MTRAGLTVVGVGASAGGLDAFSRLLDHAPADSNLSLVFVHHLTPEHAAALSRLPARKHRMTIVRAAHGMRLARGYVYVAPRNTLVEVAAGRLRLQARAAEQPFAPVDTFFRSLARWAGERAIGIVLSGTGSDGAAGVREIKALGGVTIAQEPGTASQDGMPRAAIATGSVDLALPPEQIAEHAAHLARHRSAPSGASGRTSRSLTESHLREVCAVLRNVTGIDFRHYKVPTIRRRLIRRMALLRMADAGGYVRWLSEHPAEARALSQDLLIRVTRFFRDPESFAALAAQVIGPLVESRGDEAIRVWVPGCATGEEAYSVAICLLEEFGERGAEGRVQIFATDVSEDAVETARAGIYPGSIAADVSAERLTRYFSRTDGGFRVAKAVRDSCVFARHDLTRDPPFSRLDLILCRNVLIYLDAAMQNRLMSVFHYALSGNGVLMLGPAETAGTRGLFAAADKKHRIFRKVPMEVDVPVILPAEPAPRVPRSAERLPEHPLATRLVQDEATRLILERFAPAAVLVDRAYNVIQFRGLIGRYLEAPVGESTWNVLTLAGSDLLYPLRAALESAARRGRSVRNDGVTITHGGESRSIAVEVVPLGPTPRQYFLVLFSDGAGERPPDPRAARPSRGAPRDERGRAAELRRELAATREYLQSIIQELEAANAELQSANEEILSSNEELQSANEELDTAREELESTNETLSQVNDELQARNEELSRVNSDLLNLLGSVDMPIVIVGSRLEIRRFTPKAEQLFNLSPRDIGRPIGDITPNFNQDGLDALIRETIEEVAPREREVCDNDGHWHMVRIRPCTGIDNRLDGALIAVIDIDPVTGFDTHVVNEPLRKI